MRLERMQLVSAWMAQVDAGRGALRADRRLQIGLLVSLLFSLGLGAWSIPHLLVSIQSWRASGIADLTSSLWQLLFSLLGGLLLLSVLNALVIFRSEQQQLLVLLPMRPATLLRLVYGSQLLTLWNWLLLQALICGWALLLALGWEGLPWFLLLLIGACLAVWLGLHVALLYMCFLLSSQLKRLKGLMLAGGGLVLLGASGWLLSRRMEFAQFLAVLLSIAPWYIFLGGVVVLAFLLGPLASMQGHFLARTLYAVQSLDRSPRAWMPPGLSQLQDVFERRRTLLSALFVKALAHQGRNIFFWLRLALLGLGLICAGWVHTWAAPLALTQRALARRKLRRFNGGSEACPGFCPCIAQDRTYVLTTPTYCRIL